MCHRDRTGFVWLSTESDDGSCIYLTRCATVSFSYMTLLHEVNVCTHIIRIL
jgi:hypothetical protein